QNKDQAFDALMGLVGQAAFEKQMGGETLDIETLKDLTLIASVGLKAKTDAYKIAQKDREIELSRDKFEEQRKTEIEKAFDAFYALIKPYPELIAAYKTFKAQVEQAGSAAKK